MMPVDNFGRRQNVPQWFIDPDIPAPCICGESFDTEEPYILAEDNSTGLKRYWHLRCWNNFVQQSGDE